MRMLLLSVPILLAACDQPGPIVSAGSTVVDGYQVYVHRYEGTNDYFAQAPQGGPLKNSDHRRYSINIRAIEKVTGCKADMATIDNYMSVFGGVSRVTVICK